MHSFPGGEHRRTWSRTVIARAHHRSFAGVDGSGSLPSTLPEMLTRPLTLMAVHAHPDDEAISTGGILARSAAEGVRTVLVTCTNGELGDAPGGLKPGDPGHDERLVVPLRRRELEASCEVLDV
jgi:GlcNAc-PI de-N-acetylase